MATKKSTHAPANGGATAKALAVKKDGKGKIWSHVRAKWLDETPEEAVRQHYLCVLVNEYGFAIEQMSEEMEVTGRGSGHARADFVIWRSAKDKADGNNPLIIVECKSDNVTIKPDDYGITRGSPARAFSSRTTPAKRSFGAWCIRRCRRRWRKSRTSRTPTRVTARLRS